MTVKVVNQDTTLKEVIVVEAGHFTEHMKPKMENMTTSIYMEVMMMVINFETDQGEIMKSRGKNISSNG